MKHLPLVAAAAALICAGGAKAQVIGSFDNFDVFNDTGVEAEGFEIDIEDVSPGDVTRTFPSNFSSTLWVIRYGLPTVTAYDFTKTTPDPEHAYDAGHKGVLVTWAATWDAANKKWVAQYGSQPYNGTTAGDGTPYVKNPTYTNGESCWYFGLGNAYPTSGCDHFGISFAAGVAYGKITYHWKVPNPSAVGQLQNAALEATIPPSPVLVVNPPVAGKPPVVHAVAEAPENPDPQWGPAYWAKVTTLYLANEADLDRLQKANVAQQRTVKVVNWSLLQRPPVGEPGEAEDVADDAVAGKHVAVVKQYEYYKFKGAYDSETHQALCDIATTKANLDNNVIATDCSRPFRRTYWVQDPVSGDVQVVGGNLGAYIGAHINAYNAK